MKTKAYSALEKGYVCCRQCHKIAVYQVDSDYQECSRCQSKIYPRIPNSIMRSWVLLLSGFLLYIPANILPIMSVNKGGDVRTDTIMSGIIHLMDIDMLPIAIIVFVASILVPLLKMLALAWILMAIQLKWRLQTHGRAKMYHMLEFIGRWSMLDIFVISILLGIVKFHPIASVDLMPAALLFEIVVILTMLAAIMLDSRLIWQEVIDND